MEQLTQQPNQKRLDIQENLRGSNKFRRKALIFVVSLFIISSIISLPANYQGLLCDDVFRFICFPTPVFGSSRDGLAADYGLGLPFQYAIKQSDVGGWTAYIWYPQSIIANLVFWFLVVVLTIVIIRKAIPRRTS
ncbi:MAG: hypothetical protein AAB583_02920 [Patescibacteria group bacterium]